MSDTIPFEQAFQELTDVEPFPWQSALYARFAANDIPSCCNLPTGLGKTAVIPIWLLALANHSRALPRRLVYVVNRRTVVDQATREAERLRDRLINAGQSGVLAKMSVALSRLAFRPHEEPLAISTLRGQFADNAAWRMDPARPAIIVGTVDMIGSRLLFSGYRLGFKSRPLHAGLLGQDALLVHDEAHLEPAFQTLATAIANEQRRCGDLKPLQVMELSATPRSTRQPFELTDAERRGRIPEVKKRMEAQKTLRLSRIGDEKETADRVARLALEYRDGGQAILIFVRKLDDVEKIVKKLPKERTCQLTGTMRGFERDELIRGELPTSRTFLRFLPLSARPSNISPKEGTVWLVCTSAGEVGINISADHLVCDLTPFDSMVQRFGRVNRFGDGSARVDVVHPTDFAIDEFDERRRRTLKLMRAVDGSVSPATLSKLPNDERLDASTPSPVLLLRAAERDGPPGSPVAFDDQSAWELLFDAWSLTSIRDVMPGRPAVADYLHGIAEWQPSETYVAWRQEVAVVQGAVLAEHSPAELLADYPLKPHELLRDRSDRVLKHIQRLAENHPESPAWIVRDDEVNTTTLSELASGDKDRLNDVTIILPPAVGGLTAGGTLGAEEETEDLDVADKWYFDDLRTKARRIRLFDDDPAIVPKTSGMRLVRSIRVAASVDRQTPEESDDDAGRNWCWYVAPQSADDDGSKVAVTRNPVRLRRHNADVAETAKLMVKALRLNQDLCEAITFAAAHHDDGKARRLWQLSIGNRGQEVFAKSGNRRPPEVRIDFRHEFGSMLDVLDDPSFSKQCADSQDLILQIIAAHHGRARPHFEPDEIFDPERAERMSREVANEVPRRFARLQRKYGRWGLAYLESLLRASDAYASAHPTEETP
jgi:CRISPR-associated endonuclease/helicase Cas3